MKKLIFTALLSIAVFASGCGSYSNPAGSTGKKPGNSGSSGVTDKPFTVNLEYDDEKYIPDNGLKAQWYDGTDFKYSGFDSEGVASVTGLDGDYSVTLDGLDDRFTYNPNIYFASNDDRDVTIILYDLTSTYGRGVKFDELYIYGEGYYRATFRSDKDMQEGIFFAYVPQNRGIYTVESYVDLTLNEINPRLNVYVGNKSFTGDIQQSVDDGSLSSNFTKNFKYEVEVKSVGQSVYYRFAVIFESRSAVSYPLNIDFQLRYQSEAGSSDPPVKSILKPAEEDFAARRTQFDAKGLSWQPSGWTYSDKSGYFYPDDVRFNSDDGLWHVWDKDTGSFGVILWARIKSDNKIFQTESGMGFYDSLVSTSYVNGYNYDSFINNYSANVNGDGCYPVTAELKEFLQNFAINQRYFMDGRGWAEDMGYKAAEESQWLFACGYYTTGNYV